jgi:hypothetical protein
LLLSSSSNILLLIILYKVVPADDDAVFVDVCVAVNIVVPTVVVVEVVVQCLLVEAVPLILFWRQAFLLHQGRLPTPMFTTFGLVADPI